MDDFAKQLEKLKRQEAKARGRAIWFFCVTPFNAVGCVGLGFWAETAQDAGLGVATLILLVLMVLSGLWTVLLVALAISALREKLARGKELDILLGIETELEAEGDTEKRPIDSSAE
jgi:hypothetical protein